jgi:protein-tyrosine phosphatase
MHRIEPFPLWLGHSGDLRNPALLFAAEIQAIVDLAANEPFPQLPRDFVYCRFPLLDGEGNDPALLRVVVRAVGELMSVRIPTILCCSNGLSRTPAIAAATIGIADQSSLDAALIRVASQVRHDVSPALWRDLKDALAGSALPL